MSRIIVQIFDDEEYIGDAFIEGVKFVKGKFGWYPTLELLTLKGEKIDGWGYSVYPYTPMLDYMERKNENGPD
jgi:hypothetical protein